MGKETLNNGTCDCDETLVRGVRVAPPPLHDCNYVRLRDSLIRKAEEIANSYVTIKRRSEDDGASSDQWTRCFSIAMDSLSKPLLNGKNGSTQ
jgi:hypothetical protein